MNRPLGALALSVAAALGCAGDAALRDPARPDPRAPDVFVVRFETSAGPFEVEVTRSWAPRGADRFHRLVQAGYYDGSKIFRVIPGYIVQFGIAADPALARAWRFAYIPDDPSRQKCRRGIVGFADKAPNTRATQIFVNLADNPQLDTGEFAPFGRVVLGMDVVDHLHGYGRAGPQGERTDQSAIFERGNAYLEEKYPALDTIVRATAARGR
ncbi:MAG TPA: peptidylprolyl isomerase [Thermoanaerobaculia bacterium]|nr:peptidylprolyl isomerase [Thermoanaerobaculia bacterium]